MRRIEKQRPNVRLAQVSLPCFQEDAHDVPDHVLEEATAPYFVYKPVARAARLRGEDGSHRGFSFAIAIVRGGEHREIMLAFQQRRKLLERLLVQWIGKVIRVTPFEWRDCF